MKHLKQNYLTWEDRDNWPLTHFTPEELACRGSGALLIDFDAAMRLERLRAAYGAPITVVSAYRTKAWNQKVGGAPNSQHLYGRAFDLGCVDGRMMYELLRLGFLNGFTGFGVYKNFVHLDTGAPRAWGNG